MLIIFRLRQHGMRGLIVCPEFFDRVAHCHSRFTARILGRMAISANRFIADTQHRITRFEYLMITMTGGAPRNSHLDKELPVLAFAKELRVNGVTLATNIPYPRDAGRRGAVVSMTVVTGGRRQISLTRHHFPMHALLVPRHLIGGNLVGRHAFCVGVARTASVGHTRRINRRTRIARRPYRMRYVTTGAGRDFLIVEFFRASCREPKYNIPPPGQLEEKDYIAS